MIAALRDALNKYKVIVFDGTDLDDPGQERVASWFGELLTEKYNPGRAELITPAVFRQVYGMAVHAEWNNTVLNLTKKVDGLMQITKLATIFDISDDENAAIASFKK